MSFSYVSCGTGCRQFRIYNLLIIQQIRHIVERDRDRRRVVQQCCYSGLQYAGCTENDQI